jgi:hypothetical protein
MVSAHWPFLTTKVYTDDGLPITNSRISGSKNKPIPITFEMHFQNSADSVSAGWDFELLWTDVPRDFIPVDGGISNCKWKVDVIEPATSGTWADPPNTPNLTYLDWNNSTSLSWSQTKADFVSGTIFFAKCDFKFNFAPRGVVSQHGSFRASWENPNGAHGFWSSTYILNSVGGDKNTQKFLPNHAITALWLDLFDNKYTTNVGLALTGIYDVDCSAALTELKRVGTEQASKFVQENGFKGVSAKFSLVNSYCSNSTKVPTGFINPAEKYELVSTLADPEPVPAGKATAVAIWAHEYNASSEQRLEITTKLAEYFTQDLEFKSKNWVVAPSSYSYSAANSVVPMMCANGKTDGLETDKDCGGGYDSTGNALVVDGATGASYLCPRCATDKLCNTGSDCQSGACNVGATVKQCLSNGTFEFSIVVVAVMVIATLLF